MNSITQPLRLRSRIYLSSGLLVGVCCIASAIGWFGQSILLENFSEYENAELVSLRVLEIDRNVQQLKSQSETYIHSGADSARRSAIRLLDELVTQIAETRDVDASDELSDLLDEMSVHLQLFGQQLQLAAHERQVRTSIVNVQLPQKASQVLAAVEQLDRSSEELDSRESSLAWRDVVQAFGEGRMNLLRYLIDPNANQLDKSLACLKRAEAKAALMVADDVDLQQQGQQLSKRLAEFRQLSLRAAQATRGYLYHSNVVMAGEISEFVYYSDRVKRFVDAQRQRNRLDRNATASHTRQLSVVASLVSLIFAGLLATSLSYSIVRPISLLTDAFRRLARGETLADIPGTERSDEIGRMSRAAEVFSAKNQETHDLLSKSQSLSSELAAKAKALEETNLELDNFAYVASHDLKAPLRGINCLAEWVNEDCDELLPDDSKHHLAQMQDRVKKMDALLDDLLEYSRVGRCDPQCETVDLREVVSSIIELSDQRQGIRIAIVSPLPTIHTAITPLKQVILNLITNAIKYNDQGDQGYIEISCEDLGSEIRMSVVDNGMGIDPRYHERVFQMYQRIAPAHIEGSGMGLAIVKKQVECHGGCVTLESKLGQGCRISFTWPKQGHQQNGDASQPELAGAIRGI